ncbi:uncharacterized protein RHO25_006672 [Cercospora beticola]|uniref:Uncharacterized protein n=1 Tax=Cercospora beticola TaxID=122368 RepID=A0ABZ0NR92_CERBT|nr:hypothetical protein RHO25_006672 [Cercospora beticola]
MDNTNSTLTEAEITLATTIAEWTFFFGTMGYIMAAIFIATHILERAPAFLSLPGHGVGSIKELVLLWFWPIIILGMLSPILMAHIIHNGVHVAGLTLVPQILPSTCEQAQQFHPFDMTTSWPCAKDELIDLWRSGALRYDRFVQDGGVQNIILAFLVVYLPLMLIMYIIAAVWDLCRPLASRRQLVQPMCSTQGDCEKDERPMIL